MKALNRTILIFIAVNLLAAGRVQAQKVPEKQPQAEFIQKQAEAAKKQAEAAKKQAELVKKQSEIVARLSLPSIPFKGTWPFLSSSPGAVLVIPSAEIKTQDILAINEDMNVMSRIFEKNLQQANISPSGSGLFTSSRDALLTLLRQGKDTIQGMYLQDYGAVFLMKVDFPLSAIPQLQEEQEIEKEKETDQVWEQMRQEIYEPEETAKGKSSQAEEKYDAEKVENLTETIIKTFKHATNIRILEPDERVIFAVTGSGKSSGQASVVGTTKAVNDKDNNAKILGELVQDGSSPTMLIIRAKKVDIDGFAKGDLDLDQFRQRAQILTCPYLAEVTGGGDSLSSYFYKGGRY